MSLMRAAGRPADIAGSTIRRAMRRRYHTEVTIGSGTIEHIEGAKAEAAAA
jgi:hypothetical protein